MIATVARTALSALLLSAFSLFSPVAPAAPETSWTLQVDAAPTSVEVGDSVSVRVTVLRDGLPGQMGLIQYRATVETSPGNAQDLEEPIFLPAAPIEGNYTAMPDPWIITWTARAPGLVRIHVHANGEVAEVLEDGSIIWHFTNAEGRSGDVTVVEAPPARPVTIPEPVTLVLFGAGVVALGAAIARRRRNR